MKIKLSDLVIMHEPIPESGIVIDVGTYKGEYVDLITKRFNCNVFCYEPDPQLYRNLVSRFEAFPKISISNTAIGNTGVRKLYLSKNGLANSFYPEWAKSKLSIDVTVQLLSSLVKNLAKVDILKLNCEGAEYEILDDLIENNLLDRFGEILLQFHKTENKRRKWALEDKLEEKFNRVYDYKIQLWKKR